MPVEIRRCNQSLSYTDANFELCLHFITGRIAWYGSSVIGEKDNKVKLSLVKALVKDLLYQILIPVMIPRSTNKLVPNQN